jgi:predicted type IV restriction endonuclease
MSQKSSLASPLESIEMQDTLLDIQTKMQNNLYRSHQHVRLSVVGRILSELGWDLWDPREVDFGFMIPDGAEELVCCLFSSEGDPLVFIKTEPPEGIKDSIQDYEYILRHNNEYAPVFSIVTDGNNWHFYHVHLDWGLKYKRFLRLCLDKTSIEKNLDCFQTFLSKESFETKTAIEKTSVIARELKTKSLINIAVKKASPLLERPPYPNLLEAIQTVLHEKGIEISQENIARVLQTRHTPQPDEL